MVSGLSLNCTEYMSKGLFDVTTEANIAGTIDLTEECWEKCGGDCSERNVKKINKNRAAK